MQQKFAMILYWADTVTGFFRQWVILKDYVKFSADVTDVPITKIIGLRLNIQMVLINERIYGNCVALILGIIMLISQ